MGSSTDLQLLLRFRPYPMRGHRLSCNNLLILLLVTWLVWLSGEGHRAGIGAEARRQRNFDSRTRRLVAQRAPPNKPAMVCSPSCLLHGLCGISGEGHRVGIGAEAGGC